MRVDDTPELRHALARAVLDNLEDRRGLRQQLEAIRSDDPDTYAEIESTIGGKLLVTLARFDKEKP